MKKTALFLGIIFLIAGNFYNGTAQTALQDSAFSLIKKVLDHYGKNHINSMNLISYGFTDTSGNTIEDSVAYNLIFSKEKLYYGNSEIEFIKSDSFLIEVDHEDKTITVSKYKTQYNPANVFMFDSVFLFNNQVNNIIEENNNYIISLNLPSLNCLDYKITIDKNSFSLKQSDMLLYEGYDFYKKEFTGLYKVSVFYPDQTQLKNFPDKEYGVNKFLTKVNNQFKPNDNYNSYQLKIIN